MHKISLRRRARAVLVAASLLATTAAAQSRATDSTTVRVWAAVLRTHDTRSSDTAAIDEALASRIAPLRAAATRVVGLNRIAARYGTLRTMLQTERDSAVASDAAFALGTAADTASCAALRTSLERRATALAAAWALGELAERCGTFSEELSRARETPARAALLRGAFKWKVFPDSDVAAAFTSATAPGVRWSALFALARAKRPAGATFAFPASHDAQPAIREVASRLLSADVQPASMAASSMARLDSLLTDSAAHVRVAAIRSIATWKSPASPALERAWQRETDANVRVTLAQAIATVAPDTAALWVSWWNSDTTHAVRRTLIASASQAGAMATLSTVAGDSVAQRAYTSSYGPRSATDTAPSIGVGPSQDYERIVRDIVLPSLAGRSPQLVILTARGPIRITLDGVRAPMTSDNISRLAQSGYFRDMRFHRVVPAFVAQAGDPTGTGGGGPGFRIRDELNRSPYVRGAVGMALSGPDTGGSQFFLTVATHPHLDGHYTVFGRVTDGLAAMDALRVGDAIVNISAELR